MDPTVFKATFLGMPFLLWLSKTKSEQRPSWPLPQWDLIRPSLWQTLWLNFDFCLNPKKTSTGTLKKTQKPQVIQAMTCLSSMWRSPNLSKRSRSFHQPNKVTNFLAVGCSRVAAAVVLGRLQGTGCGWFTSGDSWMYPYLWVWFIIPKNP